ncbi:MAG: hypothetical protein GTO24_02310, partial [candidate division Zixibacteria bacterium]|nr:hypothetical protein [candidate division Zixibacteria bacterium]
MKMKNCKPGLSCFLILSFLLYLVFAGLITATAQEIELPPIKKTTLDNGLKLIVIEHHELPVVAFRLILKCGSVYDPPGKAGLADLTAGLLRKGTKTRSATQIAQEIDFVGGSLGAGSGRDATYATCQVLAKHFDLGLDLLSDIVLNPTFKEDEIDRLRNQTLGGIKEKKRDPESVADDKFKEFLFGNHPYGQPAEGTEQSVAAIVRDDIVNFHKKHYVPNNSILAVVGDVQPEEAIRKVKAKFSRWKAGEITAPSFTEPPAIKGHEILLVDNPELTQTYIRLGHLGIERKNPDYFAVKVMNYILGGGGFASRLVDEVRSKRGLTYDIHCIFDYNKL